MPGGRSSAVHPIVITLTGNFANSSGTGGGGGGCQPQAANMVMPNSEAIHLRILPILWVPNLGRRCYCSPNHHAGGSGQGLPQISFELAASYSKVADPSLNKLPLA